jgi:hypothetical protein
LGRADGASAAVSVARHRPRASTPRHDTGAASTTWIANRPSTMETKMIRQRSIAAPPEHKDRSMRYVEYALAIVAFVVSGILTLARQRTTSSRRRPQVASQAGGG